MVAHVTTVSFQGIEAVPVDVQVQIVPGLSSFIIVGLPDKTVAESRERVRSALHASGLALPPKRVIVNLAPADLPKEGSQQELQRVEFFVNSRGPCASLTHHSPATSPQDHLCAPALGDEPSITVGA